MIRIDEKFQKPIRPEKIIQFGEGVFLRGFVDWLLQALNDSGLFCGSAVLVQHSTRGRCDVLNRQNGLYTHILRGAEGTRSQIIDVCSRGIDPHKNYGDFLALADDPGFRFIVSNTTEAGIAFCQTDRLQDAPPSTFPARLTSLLYRRYRNGLDGFILLPCELIERNGDVLKKTVLRYAALWELEPGFIRWIETNNHFCNTLVDRIVTGYPKNDPPELGYADELLNTSEHYHLWVIEGDKTLADELPLHKLGLNIVWTEDLEPYRTRKVRILNGAHTSMVPYGLLQGFTTVRSCVEDPEMLAFIRQCVYDEIIPTLELPREELISYADDVLQRFANPYIDHYLSDISLNSVSKFRVRVLPSILAFYEQTGELPEALLRAFAALIRFYKEGTPRDDASIIAQMRALSLREILENTQWWGLDCSFMYEKVSSYAVESKR